MNLSRRHTLALALALLPACVGAEGDPLSLDTDAVSDAAPKQATVEAAQAQSSLNPGVERLSSQVSRDDDALSLSGQLRIPGRAGAHDVDFEVVGVPGPVPETFDAQVEDAATGAQARLVYRPDWRSLKIEVPGHTAELAHNPDGSYSAAGRTFSTLTAAAHALVADDALNALTGELLISATVALRDAAIAANTRIPDGYCDPLWVLSDPDCQLKSIALPLAFGQAYACDRWGAESQSCAFFEASLP